MTEGGGTTAMVKRKTVLNKKSQNSKKSFNTQLLFQLKLKSTQKSNQ